MEDNTLPIAIVGLSCRLPGASNPEDLWRVCAEQRDVWQPIPKERMNHRAFYHPDPGRNSTSNVRGGHFLQDNPGLFDATFFNLTSAEARAMDPQQRLLLELSYEALENAGISLSRIHKSDTAVFVGSSCSDYGLLLHRDNAKTELFQSLGLAATMLSNRISYFYDLKGPSVTVDTACSSSLVALHLACNAIRAGETRMAIVGGSNLILTQEPIVDLSTLRFLSPDGRCYTYDDRGNGFGRGEGAACLILKRFDDALKEGDTVRAVVRNSGSNQDGRTNGISLPSGDAQVGLIERTYGAAGLDPAQTSYVEAHGTGTPAGDPIEAASLSKVFAQQRPVNNPLTIGSIKSNIGHLEGGSGVAGVVKAVLMLENKLILPNFDFQKPSARIPMQKWNIQVPTCVQTWPTEAIHRASVNNFGFGGSNAHVILEDASGYMSSHGLVGKYQRPTVHSKKTHEMTNGYIDPEEKEKSRVFILSSFSELSGKEQAKALSQYLTRQQESRSSGLLADLAYTLGERRSTLPWKTAFVAASLSQLAEALNSEDVKPTKAPKVSKLGFVFSGQGAQWYGMGRELIAEYPIFRRSLELANNYLRALGASWILMDELSKDASTSRVGSASLSQPLTTAIQIALVDLLASWNIKPARVVGHSSGEIAAAYCAGALTQESAMAVAYYRGKIASRVKDSRDGAMLAVGLSEEEANAVIATIGKDCIKIACVNSPSNVTISGDRSSTLKLYFMLQARGVFVRELAVEVAYHSHHMEDVADEYLAALQGLPVVGDSEVEFHSSVSGKRINSAELEAGYWVSNLVNTVQFSRCMHSLLFLGDSDTAVDTLVEIGPHSALQGPIKQILQHHPKSNPSIQYISALVRNSNAVHTCHNLVAKLLVKGIPIGLNAVNFAPDLGNNKVLVDLPPYTWNHSTSYWAETAYNREHSEKANPRNDILGIRVKDSISKEPRWRNIIRTSEIPWVNDHVVQSNTLYPAAGFLAMAIEAAYQHMTIGCQVIKGFRLREVTIGHALVISKDAENVETMVSLRPYSESLQIPSSLWNEFSISSSADGVLWAEHCRGLISIEEFTQGTEVDGGRWAQEEGERFFQMTSIFEKECTTAISTIEMYKALDKLGLSFGPTFANLRKVRASSDRCLAEVVVPDTAAIMPSKFEYPFIIHPATLDSCIHAVFPLGHRYSQQDKGTPVPTFIEELFVSHSIEKVPGHVFSVYAQSKAKDSARPGLKTDSLVIFEKGKIEFGPKIIMNGLVFASLANDTKDEIKSEERRLCYQTNWQPDPSLLTSLQATEISAASRKPFPQDDQACIAEQAAFYYAERALQKFSTEEVVTMQPHHQKLYASLVGFCKAVHDGQLGMFPTIDWLHLNPEQHAAIFARVADTSYGTLLCPMGENLLKILRQEIDPLSVMVEKDRLERHYRTFQPLEQSHQQAADYIKLLGNKNPFLNVLEIGAGTGGATLPILNALSGPRMSHSNFTNYDFTDCSPAFFEKAKEKIGPWSKLVTFKTLDIESDPTSQDYKLGSYDLIIAANVVHATRYIEKTMKHIRSLLKPGGTLVLIEMTVKTLASTLVFGTLPGWWNAEEEDRVDGPLLNEDQWNNMLLTTGFTGANAVLLDMPDTASHNVSTIVSTAPLESHKGAFAITIITDAEASEPCYAHLESLLTQAGIQHKTARLPECDPTDQVCVVLCELARPVLRNPLPNDYEAMKRVFLESSGVLWVTEGALIEAINPDLSLVTGLARTIRLEKGDGVVVTLDLDALNHLSSMARAEKIFSVLVMTFGKEHTTARDIELEYAERNGIIMIPRMGEDVRLSSSVPSATESTFQPYYKEGSSLKAEIRNPGLLDSIEFVVDDSISKELPHDYVEVQVKASGINFRDIMTALGQISAYPLGCECSGVVSAVGRSVQNFRPGDHVIATVNGCVCNIIRASAEDVELVPQNIPLEVAAALPIVYFTAYWAVFKVARMSKDDSVLIHAASGGLGQAIINLCQIVGARVFATVGTLEKKRLLMDRFNIPESDIFSSRDNTFAEGVMKMTSGRGVDVIMNSLSGEALRLTWNCIAPFGRFVELGKRDFTINSRLEMRNFEKNVSFTGLDVPLDSQKAEKRRIWGELMALYEQGSIKAPWPLTVFSMAEMEKAYRIMQSGKHMGKMVLMPQPDEMVKVAPSKISPQILRNDASYLLIGGLGGIGRATAFWMLEHGARNFIFASPSGSDKEKSRMAIRQLRDRGARVCVFKCDIGEVADLDRVLEECRRDMPPIRGMIHGALLLRGNLFGNMSLKDYNDVMRPKVDGIWNLHNRLSKCDLDFFIMLSSVIGLAGDASQAAYSSASVFQDAFADFRNTQGLPAVTLDLGRVVDIGIVAENASARRAVEKLWSRDLGEEEVMAMMKSAIITPRRMHGPGSTITGLKTWSQESDPVFRAPLFSYFRRAARGGPHINDQEGATAPRIRESLKQAKSLEEAAQKVCDEIVSKTSSLLMIPEEDIVPSKSMSDHGIDSLVAVEMRNWFLREFEAAVPILELMMDNVSLQELSLRVVKKSKLVNHSLLEEKTL